MEEAKIARIRRVMYPGHGDTDMTSRYERVEIERFLLEDAEVLRSYIFKMYKERDDKKDEREISPIFLFKSRK